MGGDEVTHHVVQYSHCSRVKARSEGQSRPRSVVKPWSTADAIYWGLKSVALVFLFCGSQPCNRGAIDFQYTQRPSLPPPSTLEDIEPKAVQCLVHAATLAVNLPSDFDVFHPPCHFNTRRNLPSAYALR